jgi:hypothetical protein
MNFIRSIRLQGILIEEFEHHGDFMTFVDGRQVSQSYNEAFKIIAANIATPRMPHVEYDLHDDKPVKKRRTV